MLDNLRADARRLELAGRLPYPWSLIESLLFDNGFQAVVLYRMASALKRWRIPLLGPAIARLSRSVRASGSATASAPWSAAPPASARGRCCSTR